MPCALRHAPAASASSSAAASASASAPAASPVELTVVTSYGGDDGNRKNYEAAVKSFEDATGNTIQDASETSNEEWKAKVLTDFETGTEPDVLFFFTNADAEPFIEAGKVVDLATIRAAYPEYAGNMTGVLRALSPETPERPEEAEPADNAASCFLARQAQLYITEHSAERLSLQEVADHCYVSQWYLSKLLHRYLGMPFYDLLNSVRVKKAKELMEDPALRITQIAEQVGYSDTAHFSRVFKKMEGLSAGDWRNRHCGKT